MALRNGESSRKRRPVVDGRKECSRCLEAKSVEEFDTYGGKQAGIVHSRCRVCRREISKEFRIKSPDRYKSSVLKSVYGITLEEYNEIYETQGEVCAICKDPIDPNAMAGATKKRTRLDVDHCHKTGLIRGLLCRRCNTGLGHFLHDPGRLNAAIRYLNA